MNFTLVCCPKVYGFWLTNLQGMSCGKRFTRKGVSVEGLACGDFKISLHWSIKAAAMRQ